MIDFNCDKCMYLSPEEMWDSEREDYFWIDCCNLSKGKRINLEEGDLCPEWCERLNNLLEKEVQRQEAIDYIYPIVQDCSKLKWISDIRCRVAVKIVCQKIKKILEDK